MRRIGLYLPIVSFCALILGCASQAPRTVAEVDRVWQADRLSSARDIVWIDVQPFDGDAIKIELQEVVLMMPTTVNRVLPTPDVSLESLSRKLEAFINAWARENGVSPQQLSEMRSATAVGPALPEGIDREAVERALIAGHVRIFDKRSGSWLGRYRMASYAFMKESRQAEGGNIFMFPADELIFIGFVHWMS